MAPSHLKDGDYSVDALSVRKMPSVVSSILLLCLYDTCLYRHICKRSNSNTEMSHVPCDLMSSCVCLFITKSSNTNASASKESKEKQIVRFTYSKRSLALAKHMRNLLCVHRNREHYHNYANVESTNAPPRDSILCIRCFMQPS